MAAKYLCLLQNDMFLNLTAFSLRFREFYTGEFCNYPSFSSPWLNVYKRHWAIMKPCLSNNNPI